VVGGGGVYRRGIGQGPNAEQRIHSAHATFVRLTQTRSEAASRHLKALESIGVLREQALGRETLFMHPKLVSLLARNNNAHAPYFFGDCGQRSWRW